jgi:uncharacterized protein
VGFGATLNKPGSAEEGTQQSSRRQRHGCGIKATLAPAFAPVYQVCGYGQRHPPCGLWRLTSHSEIPLQDRPKTGKRQTSPLRVLLISDGRPGHYRQSEGVVAALARRRAVSVERLDLKTRRLIPKGFIPKLGRLLPPKLALQVLHGIDASDVAPADLIVSSGGATLAANMALARLWSAPNVFSGSTRGFPLDAFSLVLTPYPSVARPPVVVAGAKPTPFDPDRVPPPRALTSPQDLRGRRVSVLIGGPTSVAELRDGDWDRLARLIGELAAGWHCRITVVTSPRTPEAAYARLVPVAGEASGAVTLIDYRTAGPGSIEAAFDCDAVLITADSMSMMTEAALSRRPAVGLAPAITAPHRDDEAVAALVAEKWLAMLPLASANAAAVALAAAALKPMAENHLDRLADVILHAISAPDQRT